MLRGLNLEQLSKTFSVNMAVSMAGHEARPIIMALLSGLAVEDIVYAVTNSVNLIDVSSPTDVTKVQELLQRYLGPAEFVLQEEHFPRFLAAASPQHYQLLAAIPGGLEWAKEQVRSFM